MTEGDTLDDYTIEPDRHGEGGMPYNVYGWGIYGDDSVLAGQQRKAFVDAFWTVEDALKEYPDASVGFVDAHNTFDHLPDYEMTAREEEQFFNPREDY